MIVSTLCCLVEGLFAGRITKFMRFLDKQVVLLLLTVFLFCSAAAQVYASGRTFAVLGKSSDDPNFIEVAAGCQLAASAQGDRCSLLQVPGSATPRPQLYVLRKALESKRFAAIAVSVIMPDPVAEVVRSAAGTPIVTFDSPFNAENKDLSESYVGADNVAFGRDLAKIAKHFKPQGGRIIIMSAPYDQNLTERLIGVRRELSGHDVFAGDARLQGEGSWVESRRSPWLTGDNIGRTLDQLTYSINSLDVDVILSVGQWPIVRPDLFRQAVQPYLARLRNRETLIIVGVGNVSPALTALLDEGMVAGVVSIDFQDMGRRLYQVMNDVVAGGEIPEQIFIPNRIIFGR